MLSQQTITLDERRKLQDGEGRMRGGWEGSSTRAACIQHSYTILRKAVGGQPKAQGSFRRSRSGFASCWDPSQKGPGHAQ